MVILFDADGVLFDTEYFQQRKKIVDYFLKRNKSIVDANGYGIKDVYNCTREEEIQCWIKNIIDYSYFFPLRPDMKILINQLQKEENKVYCVTSKACSLEKNIKGIGVRALFETGLKKHGINFDGIYYCSLENSAQEKAEVCKSLKGDIFIEDSIYNIDELRHHVKVLAMHTKNNSKIEFENVTRVYSADDIYREIKKIEYQHIEINNIFSEFELLSREQRMHMTRTQLLDFYKLYRKYLCSLPFDHELLEKQEKNYIKLSSGISFLFNNLYNIEIIGLKNIPKNTNYVLVSNHLCNKDMPLLATAFRDKPWHSLNRIEDSEGVVGFLFNEIGATFVDRKDTINRHLATVQMLKKAVHGKVNLIFPEGTKNKTSYNLAPFQGKSPIYISQIAQIPILPIAITDTYKNKEKTLVRIGKPIMYDGIIDMEEANQDLYNTMSTLVEQNKRYIKKRGSVKKC